MIENNNFNEVSINSLREKVLELELKNTELAELLKKQKENNIDNLVSIKLKLEGGTTSEVLNEFINSFLL